jgi:predicted RNA-binding protein with PUA-like domain
MNYWLVKSEPSTYSWGDLVKDGRTCWDGVRNYQARNNLKAMRKGELVLYHHSGAKPEVVGIAKVVKESYQDPTTDDDRWVAIDLEPAGALMKPVPLEDIKKEKRVKDMALLKQGRLSVSPVTKVEFDVIVSIGSKDK